MKAKNIFLGVFFILAAGVVIASQFGVFGVLGFWSILATVLLAAIIVASLPKLNFFGVLLPLALLYMIFEEPLALYAISPWLLVAAAILGSIGLSLIFRRKPQYHCDKNQKEVQSYGGYRPEAQNEENSDDNHPYVKTRFGASSRYLHSDALKNGQFISSFGSMEVFFDQATLAPTGAEVYLDCSFGAIKLYVPKSWPVQDNINTMLGGVDNDTRMARPDNNLPSLRLTGNVQFGGIEIQYV